MTRQQGTERKCREWRYRLGDALENLRNQVGEVEL